MQAAPIEHQLTPWYYTAYQGAAKTLQLGIVMGSLFVLQSVAEREKAPYINFAKVANQINFLFPWKNYSPTFSSGFEFGVDLAFIIFSMGTVMNFVTPEHYRNPDRNSDHFFTGVAASAVATYAAIALAKYYFNS